ncbi:thymidine phosphorylase [Rhodalgimonas zhirmunskyi]|uniref:Thymidine phosphorylase n=1 Tax=Rhodalgimonas zhirmunskyi TaxID=2964767 RepID=A0AAJ1UEU7_9RHOB|nr:thymidine phosphorylase [Rhodoalgimonas zhirmunskyi]MDQ2094752.1 thymidine phosphorylase [Rhodoalgimonas zhirmunskyi]
MSDARHIIAAIRDGKTPSRDDLAWFAQGLADHGVSDAQAGAFAMAVLLKGLSEESRVALTLGMRDSGDVLSWPAGAPVLDKHSTGGVGDCTSLILAPALVACGARVPMISGRGLGHTGGTLDKLDAIPGFRTEMSERQFRHVVAEAGAAIIAASARIAPADKRLYAIRDVTATVESITLITASILSKKLAAGLQGLVLDVKWGSGAFMKTREEAHALATALTTTANAAGCPTSALVTDMNQPLVPSLGNALEVAEVMRILTGEAKAPRMIDLVAALGGVLLADAGLQDNRDAGDKAIRAALTSGAAAEAFGRMVAAQGGPLGFVDNWARFLPEATVIREVPAPKAGYIAAYEGEALGLCVVGLGGGRMIESDEVDPAVGLSDLLPLGTRVEKGQPLARVHAAREGVANRAVQEVLAAIEIGAKAPNVGALIEESGR